MSETDDGTEPMRVGRRWVFADGKTLPVLSGGDGPDDQGGDGGTGGGDPPPGTRGGAGAGGKTFTQEELDAVAGKARTEGRTAAEKELLKSLGIDSVEAAQAALKAHRDAEEASKTELQRAQDEAARLTAEVEAVKAQATTAVALSRLEGALRDAGVNPARIPAALRLVELDKLKVEGTEVTGLLEAVESVKATSPEWFGARGTPPPDASGGGNGTVDLRTAPSDVVEAALARYGVRR